MRLMRRSGPDGSRDDRGAVVLEVLVLAPVFFLLIDLAIYAGTAATVRSMAHHAADTAAREGSMVRRGGNAGQETAVGTSVLSSQSFADFTCGGVVADTSGFSVPLGQRAEVKYTVTCWAVARGVSFPGVPTEVKYTVTAVSVLDPYRWRSKT